MEALYIHTSHQLEKIRLGSTSSGKLLDLHEVKTASFWRAVVAEFLATALFVFLSLLSAMRVSDSEFPATGNDWYVKISLTFGLAIMAMIQMVGHVSGGHINPAVSLSMAVNMNISIIRCVFYILAQCSGATVGGAVVKAVTSSYNIDRNSGIAVTNLADDVTQAQGLVVEVLLTFVLVVVIYGTTDPSRATFGNPSVAIGLTVGLAHLAGIQYTGCGINPARSLGSAVASEKWDNHWIYWVGPLFGGVLAGLVYKFVLNPYRGVMDIEEAIKMLSDEESSNKHTTNTALGGVSRAASAKKLASVKPA